MLAAFCGAGRDHACACGCAAVCGKCVAVCGSVCPASATPTSTLLAEAPYHPPPSTLTTIPQCWPHVEHRPAPHFVEHLRVYCRRPAIRSFVCVHVRQLRLVAIMTLVDSLTFGTRSPDNTTTSGLLGGNSLHSLMASSKYLANYVCVVWCVRRAWCVWHLWCACAWCACAWCACAWCAGLAAGHGKWCVGVQRTGGQPAPHCRSVPTPAPPRITFKRAATGSWTPHPTL